MKIKVEEMTVRDAGLYVARVFEGVDVSLTLDAESYAAEQHDMWIYKV